MGWFPSLVSQTTTLFYSQVGYWGRCKRLHCVQTLWPKGPEVSLQVSPW